MTTGRYKANTKHTPRTLIWLKLKQDKLGKITKQAQKLVQVDALEILCNNL